MGHDVSQVAQEGADRPPDPSARRVLAGRVIALVLTGCAVGLALWFALSGAPGGRVVPDVMDLQAAGPDQPPPPSGTALAGQRMPDLMAVGWVPFGARVDDVANRTVSTVFARTGGLEVAFSVVSGQLLVPPRGALRLVRDGVVIHRIGEHGRTALLWRRGGRSVVMSAAAAGQTELLDLAVRITPGRS